MKQHIKRYIDCYVPSGACNFHCPYCYITQHREFNQKPVSINRSPQEVCSALSMQRWGGVLLVNFCADGETLLCPDLLPIVYALLEDGHFVSIVTNGSLRKSFEEIMSWPSELLERLFLKISFHYSELKRRHLINQFFSNVSEIKKAGISFTLELQPSDELVPYIDEIKDLSLREVGALPQLTVLRDENTHDFNLLSNYSPEEYRAIWGSFNSPMFDYKMKTIIERKRYLCYGGEWSFFLNIKNGDLRQCYSAPVIDNVYYNLNAPIHFKPIGLSCPEAYCFNCHSFAALGSLPEENAPTYCDVRDRVCADGSHWLTDIVREAFSHKLEEANILYREGKTLPKVLLIGDSICLGYLENVKERLKDKTKVISFGENTKFSANLLCILGEGAFAKQLGSDVDVVVFNSGLWDVVRIYGDPPQTSLDLYESNLRRIVRRLRYLFPNAALVFATTTRVREDQAQYAWLRKNDDVDAYNAAAEKVMRDCGVALCDLHEVTEAFDESMYLDAVHFTEQGYALLGEQITASVLDAMELSRKHVRDEFTAVYFDADALKGKKIILYGAGGFGLDCLQRMTALGIPVLKWVSSREAHVKAGRKVEHVGAILEVKYDLILLVAQNPIAVKEMQEQLNKLGVPAEKVRVPRKMSTDQ